MSGSKTISARPAASSEPPAKKMKVENGPNFANGELDEDLHSRQIAVYGRESMRRMAAAKVLVLGMKGLGVEVGAV
jgi:ubiquitin-activating enzyme E1